MEVKDCLHSVTGVADALRYGRGSIPMALKELQQVTSELNKLEAEDLDRYFTTLIEASNLEEAPKKSGLVKQTQSATERI